MNDQNAKAVAASLGGVAIQSGGNIWIVKIRRPDGSLIVISDDAVCEYAGNRDFNAGTAKTTILLK